MEEPPDPAGRRPDPLSQLRTLRAKLPTLAVQGSGFSPGESRGLDFGPGGIAEVGVVAHAPIVRPEQ